MSATELNTVDPLASEARSLPLIPVVHVNPTPFPATQAVRFAIS
jgi:hypothetical protein